MKRIAVIDIGSNSVRYMEAECTRNGVHSLFKSLETTRLAHGQGTDRKLSDESMRRTADAIIAYKEVADSKGIPVFAYATSALREASNPDSFLLMLDGVIPVEILSGEQEGRLAFYGIAGRGNTLIDIGGGSFQIVSESQGLSYPIGCVRFADRLSEGSPEELYDYLKGWADDLIQEHSAVISPVIGIGGTITTLGAISIGLTQYDKDAVSKAVLTKKTVRALLQQLFEMGDDRKYHPLLKKRHSVILQGGTILYYLMSRFSIASITCSDRDGMEGYAEMLMRRNSSF